MYKVEIWKIFGIFQRVYSKSKEQIRIPNPFFKTHHSKLSKTENKKGQRVCKNKKQRPFECLLGKNRFGADCGRCGLHDFLIKFLQQRQPLLRQFQAPTLSSNSYCCGYPKLILCGSNR
jgi:hypothetical protein